MDKPITIAGIVRATKDSVARDGECDELINLRLKNGSWRPVGTPKDFPGFDTLSGSYDRLYIHTNSYRHLFGLTNGVLSWIANIVDEAIVPLLESREILTDVDIDCTIVQTGHLLVVNSHGLHYFMYRTYNDVYDNVVSDFNTLTDKGLMPYGCVDFKVDEVVDEIGQPIWFSTKLDASGIYDARGEVGDADQSVSYSANKQEAEVLSDVLAKTRSNVAALNLFTEPFMVLTAAELYDGNFILMSEPKLMNAPSIVNYSDAHYQFLPQNTTWVKVKSPDSYIAMADQSIATHVYAADDATDRKGGSGNGFALTDCISNLYDLVYHYGGQDSRQRMVVPDNWWQMPHYNSNGTGGTNSPNSLIWQNRPYVYDEDNISDDDFKASSYAKEGLMFSSINDVDPSKANFISELLLVHGCSKHRGIHLFGTTGSDTSACFLTANKLRFRFNTTIAEEYKDIIRCISVFITKPTDFLQNPRAGWPAKQYYPLDSQGQKSHIKHNKDLVAEYFPTVLPTSDLIKRLIDETTFYKLAEIKAGNVVAGQWTDLVIEDSVLSTILSQDKLVLDSISRDSYDANVAYSYNGRLHIADYTQRTFDGWPLNHFAYYGGRGQYAEGRWKLTPDNKIAIPSNNITIGRGTPRYAGWIKTEINTGEKHSTVVRDIVVRESVVAKKPLENVIIKNYSTELYNGPIGSNCVIDDNVRYKTFSMNGGPTWRVPIDYYQTASWRESASIRTAEEVFLTHIAGIRPTLELNGCFFQWLNPLITYPSSDAKSLEIKLWDVKPTSITSGTFAPNNCYHHTFSLTAHDFLPFAYYFDPDLKPIVLSAETQEMPDRPEPENNQEHYGNRLKVSEVNSPLYFPLENTYSVGNSVIRGFAANSRLLPGGQIGDAPLLAFCSDGVYGLFVDSTGKFTYTNSRPISLLVCNNPHSITPTEAGIVFTTDSGLQVIEAVNHITEVSEQLEGDPFKLTDKISAPLNHPRLVELMPAITQENFLDYMAGAIIGYNHIDRELWLTNPSKPYSYILSQGIWSKRTDVGKQFVTDYPSTFLLSDNSLRKISHENTDGRPVAFLTRAIKLGTQEFKQTERLILRGDFRLSDKQTVDATIDAEELLKAGQQTIERVNPPVTDLVELRPGDYPEITGDYVVRRTIVVSEREAPYMPDYDFGSPAAVQNQLLPRFVVNGQIDTTQRVFDNPNDFRSLQWFITQSGTSYVLVAHPVHNIPYTFRIGDFQVTIVFENGCSLTLTKLCDLLQAEIDNTADPSRPCRVRNQAAAEDLRINRLYYYTSTSSEPISAADIDIPSNYRIIHCRRTVRPITYLKYLDYATLQHSVDPSMLVFQAVDLADDIDTSRYNNPVNISAGYYRVKGVLYKLPDLSTTYDILETLITKSVYTPVRLDFDVISGNYYHLVTRTAERYIHYTDPDATCAFADLWALPAYTPYTVNDTLQLTSGRQYHITIKVDNIDTVLQGNFTGKTNLYALNYLVEHSELFTPADPVTHLTAGSLYQFTTADGRVVLISSPDNIDVPLSRLENFTVSSIPNLAGLYLFGSYDNYKWHIIGGRELPGRFRDLGLVPYRIDCKYLRVLFVGNLTYPASIEFLEFLANATTYNLTGKPR